MTEQADRIANRVRQRILLPWVVIALGIPASFFMSAAVRDAVESAAQLRFERQTIDAKGVIEGRIRAYTDILYGLRAHFASEDHVTRLQFHRFVESLDLKNRYPGVDTLTYAIVVPARDKARFEESVRTDRSLDPRGYPNFAITPVRDHEEYWVITYLEPMTPFEFAFGLDLANPGPGLFLSYLRAHRDSGDLAASGVPINLVREGDFGLAMRLAVYRGGAQINTVEQRRAAFLGSVGAGFNIGNLMRGALSDDMRPYMQVRLSDAGPAGGGNGPAPISQKRLLFDSEGQDKVGSSPAEPVELGDVFTRVIPLEVGGRIWQLRFRAGKDSIVSPIDGLLPSLVLGTGILVSALLFGILYSLASSRSRALALAREMTRDLHESTEQLQAMSRRLVNIQEEERRHFSREFHDQIGQNLTALGINIDILKTELAGGAGEPGLARLNDVAAMVDATASAVDNIIADLRPPMLDDYGLLAALQWYGNEFTQRTGIQVNVAGGDQAGRLTPSAEIALFRITQEALNNAAKHARASLIDITFGRLDNRCILCIADNGVGFGAAAGGNAKRHQGLGMVTMRERAQALNGEFEFGPGPKGGFRIVVRVPC